MKLTLSLICVIVIGTVADNTPGFFLKVAKNVPRLGKRNNFFIKQGGKNIPRLGRRSSQGSVNDMKFYNHVQPFDSDFVLDFLSDEIVVGEGELKFVSWNDFDKALESDSELKTKLTKIAREKEIEELKKFVQNANKEANESYDHSMTYNDLSPKTVYQKFIPYGGGNSYKYNDMENEIFHYHQDTN